MLETPSLLLVVTLADAGDDGAWIEEYAPQCPLRVTAVRERHVEDDVREAVRTLPTGARAAVTIDQRFMGFLAKRAIDTLAALGVPTPSLIHPTAQVHAGTRIAVGPRVAAGALVARGVSLGDHARVLERAVIGRDASIGPFSTIDPGVIVGEGVHVGAHSWIRSGVVLEARTIVGASCELSIPSSYRGNIPEGTQQMPGLDTPARILRFG